MAILVVFEKSRITRTAITYTKTKFAEVWKPSKPAKKEAICGKRAKTKKLSEKKNQKTESITSIFDFFIRLMMKRRTSAAQTMSTIRSERANRIT